MKIDEKDAERLARDLIGEIAAEWENKPDAYHVEKDGEHIFVFTLQPAKITRDGRTIERPASTSVIHFNPLAEATEIVVSLASNLEESVDKTIVDYVLPRDSKHLIRQMLVSAPGVFRDATWQARIVAETLHKVEINRVFGRPDIAREEIDSAVVIIVERLRDGLGRIPKTRRPKITNFTIHTALRKYLNEYDQTGAVPSQRQFAKAIGVTPKGWRSFLEKHSLGEHESAVKKWLAELSASDRQMHERVGTLRKRKSPQGD